MDEERAVLDERLELRAGPDAGVGDRLPPLLEPLVECLEGGVLDLLLAEGGDEVGQELDIVLRAAHLDGGHRGRERVGRERSGRRKAWDGVAGGCCGLLSDLSTG